MIRRDGIDVLVDLSGHTAGSRLLVFARRPAPVQVAYLLGHGYTSGLSAMDAFLADAMLAPPDADALFSERIIRLPRIPLAYAPPAAMPEVAPLPALANGIVTFGYFGRPDRLNDAVIATWARILHDVPDARLVLNSAPFREPAFCDLVAARFAAQGIASGRLELIATAPQSATWDGLWRNRHCTRPIPAQCRHDHDRGTLARGPRHLAGRPTQRGTVRRDDPARRRNGRLVQRRCRRLHSARTGHGGRPARACTAREPCCDQRVADSPLCDAAGLAGHLEAAYRALVGRMLIIAPSARISRLADIEDSQRGSRIVIEDDVVIDAFVKIKPAGGSGDVVIGRGTVINSGCVLYTGNGIRIGHNVLIAANCTLAPTNHAFADPDRPIRASRDFNRAAAGSSSAMMYGSVPTPCCWTARRSATAASLAPLRCCAAHCRRIAWRMERRRWCMAGAESNGKFTGRG